MKLLVRILFYVIAIPWLTFCIWFPIAIYYIGQWAQVSHVGDENHSSWFACMMAWSIIGGIVAEGISLLATSEVWEAAYNSLTGTVIAALEPAKEEPEPLHIAPKKQRTPKQVDWR